MRPGLGWIDNSEKGNQVFPRNLFWADLAQQFRALHNRYPSLRADWHYTVNSGGPGEWRVSGAGSQTAVAQFEALARRAGASLPNPDGLELHINWLDHMRRKSLSFRFGADDRFDGGVAILDGTIFPVSEAAADFCLALEGKALEAGRLEEVDRKPSAPTDTSASIADAAHRASEPEFHAETQSVGEPANTKESLKALAKNKGTRGRRPNVERRNAIHGAIAKHGDEWRDHLAAIFAELDNDNVPMEGLYGLRIDLGDGDSQTARKWEHLDLALGKEREKVIDALRRYVV